jgi:hypothetical protein
MHPHENLILISIYNDILIIMVMLNIEKTEQS